MFIISSILVNNLIFGSVRIPLIFYVITSLPTVTEGTKQHYVISPAANAMVKVA